RTYLTGNLEIALLALDPARPSDEDLAEARQCLRTGIDGAERIGRIVRALRVAARRSEGAFAQLDVNGVLASVAALVRAQTPENVEVTFEPSLAPLLVEG